MLYLGSDHGGFRLKEQLKRRLTKQRIAFVDVGAQAYNRDDDYPDVAWSVAALVSRRPDHRGVLLCRNGVGVCVVANKHADIRAVVSRDVWTARRSRTDDDTNVLCLGADRLTENQAMTIIRAWLRTSFRNAKRDRRRLKKISTIERGR